MVGDPPKVRFEVQPDGTLKKIAPNSNSSQVQSYETCQLQELLSSSKGSVSSLLKLSVAIRSSPARDDYAKAAARYDIPSFWDIEHVKAKHGRDKYSKPWLLKRLGETITLRRKYLTYREEHNRKILTRNEGLAEQATNDGHTVAPTAIHTLPSTIATRMANDVQQAMTNMDITVADETARSQTSYELTMYEGGESTRLTVPKPPEMAFDGVPFEFGKPFMCPYCFTEQNCRDRTVWKYVFAHCFECQPKYPPKANLTTGDMYFETSSHTFAPLQTVTLNYFQVSTTGSYTKFRSTDVNGLANPANDPLFNHRQH